MFKIEKDSGGSGCRLHLIGRIQSDRIGCMQGALNDGCLRKILDLSQVTLVDLAVVRFLIGCEDEGIELAQCPPYIREWMLRERAEQAR